MSLKPPKKGDLKKSWLKPRRDTPKKIQPEYHLITTEGISTEPAYFQGVKNTINSKYRGRVQLDIIGVGDNTLNLLQKVKQKVSKSSNIYKHVMKLHHHCTPKTKSSRISPRADCHSCEASIRIEVIYFLLHSACLRLKPAVSGLTKALAVFAVFPLSLSLHLD